MRIAFFSAKSYDLHFFRQACQDTCHEIKYFETRLAPETAELAQGFPAVCVFVNDIVNAEVLETLQRNGAKLVLARSAGVNHIDREAARELGLTVLRTPEYSPHAVAEHTIALMLAANRHIHRAAYRTREMNFSLDGLLGFDMYEKTVGVVGTGRIGAVVCRILKGFGCKVLAYNRTVKPEVEALGVKFVPLDELLTRSKIVTLHLPLNDETHHIINTKTLARMRDGALLVNTSRGALVDTDACIEALVQGLPGGVHGATPDGKPRKLGGMAIDVYEEERGVFFRDLSGHVLDDKDLAHLLMLPNVIVTSHQAFFTEEALEAISRTTLQNATDFEDGRELGESPRLVVQGSDPQPSETRRAS